MSERVMVAGHFCLDITPKFPGDQAIDFETVFSPGKLTNVGDAVLSTGGPVSNTGLAMARLGVDVALNGKLGQDAFADIIKRTVGEERAKAFKVVPDQNTSYTIVLSPPGVDRFYLHNPGTNDTFGAEDVDYGLLESCTLFHFGYPPLMKRMYEDEGAELIEMYRRVKELGVSSSLDMVAVDPTSAAGRADWKGILGKVLPYTDIFMPSIDEIAFMLDRKLYDEKTEQAKREDPVLVYEARDVARIAAQLLEMGVAIAAVKCGVRGLYLRTAGEDRIKALGSACPEDQSAWSDREIWAPSYKADDFRSTLGAGDATIAGFLCGLIRDYSPEQSLQIANTVGWQNVQGIDALSGIRDWIGTIELLKDRGRRQNPTGLDSADWRFSEEEQVFYGPQDTGTVAR